jgi:hypothetical protein
MSVDCEVLLQALRSDLNFEVWRQLAAAGVAISPMQGAVALGLQLVPSSKQ